MKILVCGAGNIGSLYAGLLGHAGHQVTVVARGAKLRQLQRAGLMLANNETGELIQFRPRVVGQIPSTEAFDWAMIAMSRPHMDEVLAALADNPQIPSVLFFGNSLTGSRSLVDALGEARVVLGFPGAAAVSEEDSLRYVITSEREQPTTLGELTGEKTERLVLLAAALREAGFSVAICPQMDAWLKTHVAEICPTAYALYACGGSVQRLSEQRQVVRCMLRAMRENQEVLSAHGVPTVPSNHRLVRWIPEPVLVRIALRLLKNPAATLKLAHAQQARAEMRQLATEMFGLAAQAHMEVPCMRQLVERAERDRSAVVPGGVQVCEPPVAEPPRVSG